MRWGFVLISLQVLSPDCVAVLQCPLICLRTYFLCMVRRWQTLQRCPLLCDMRWFFWFAHGSFPELNCELIQDNDFISSWFVLIFTSIVRWLLWAVLFLWFVHGACVCRRWCTTRRCACRCGRSLPVSCPRAPSPTTSPLTLTTSKWSSTWSTTCGPCPSRYIPSWFWFDLIYLLTRTSHTQWYFTGGVSTCFRTWPTQQGGGCTFHIGFSGGHTQEGDEKEREGEIEERGRAPCTGALCALVCVYVCFKSKPKKELLHL